MADGDRAAVLVDPGVVVGDAEVVEERQHLHGEGLVELEQADVVDGQAGLGERLLGRGHRADAHHLGLDAGEARADQPHPHRQAELARRRPRPRAGTRWRRR